MRAVPFFAAMSYFRSGDLDLIGSDGVSWEETEGLFMKCSAN